MPDPFEQNLSANQAPLVCDSSASSRSLLVAFGGIAAGIGMPPFEFFRLATGLSVNKMFVRDLEQAWYQRGLPGVSTDIASTARYLAEQMVSQRIERTVFVGNSMGGYAALLFGSLIGADVVHAFAPQTFIGSFQRLFYLDRRWRKQLRVVHRDKTLCRDYFDLKPLLKTKPPTAVHLHFAASHRLDRIHCLRLRGLPNVTIHAYPLRGHNLIKHLRHDGTLQTLIRQALNVGREHAA